MRLTSTDPVVVDRLAIEDELDELLRLGGEDAGELLLVRHAEPAAGSSHDPMLSCRGLAQSERLADRLGDSRFDAVYSGPERRAQQTARIVAGAGRRSVHVLAALMDIEFDAGRSIPGARLADYAGRFAESPRWDSLPGFESRRQFRRRALQAIERILAGHPAGRVVLVSHASVINAFLSMLLGIAADRFFTPEHASISIVRWRQGRYAVRCLNDSSHLSPRPGISAPGELFTVR